VVASEYMNREFAWLPPQMLAFEALEVFQNSPKKPGEMPILADGELVGLLTLKDLLRSGIV